MGKLSNMLTHEEVGMFLRMVGEEEKAEFCDVSPDTAGALVDRDKIMFCMSCKVFHLCDGVTWGKLHEEIRTLVN